MSHSLSQVRKRMGGTLLVGSGSVILVALFFSNRDYFDTEANSETTAKLIRVSRRDLSRTEPLLDDKDLIKAWTQQRQEKHSQMSFFEKWSLFSKLPSNLDVKQIKSTNNYYAPYLAEALEQEHKSRTVILPGTALGILTSVAGQFLTPRGTWLKFASLPLAAFLFLPMCAVQAAREDLALDVLNMYQKEEEKMALQPKLMTEERDGVTRFG